MECRELTRQPCVHRDRDVILPWPGELWEDAPSGLVAEVTSTAGEDGRAQVEWLDADPEAEDRVERITVERWLTIVPAFAGPATVAWPDGTADRCVKATAPPPSRRLHLVGAAP